MRAGKNHRSRVFVALLVVCCALNLSSIVAAASQGASSSRELLDQGRKLLEAGKLAEAVAGLRIALAIDPNSAQALYKLSRALHNTDPEESNRLSDQFLRLKAQNSVVDQAKALANEAFHAFTVQNWRESVRLFSEALETCGDCEIESTLHRDLGLTLCRDGQIERGAEELRKALALNPEDRDAAKALEMIPTR